MAHVNALAHVCRFPGFLNDKYSQHFADESIYQTIQDIAPTLNDTISESFWEKSTAQMVPVLTGNGLCFAYNSINSDEMYTNEYATFIFNFNGISRWVECNLTFNAFIFK